MYEEIHPNVTINIINNPWDGFFTKLPLSLQKGEEGPTLFNVHNSYENLILNYMAPFDIDTDELIADYPSAASHVKRRKYLLRRLRAVYGYGVLQQRNLGRGRAYGRRYSHYLG